MRTIFHTVALVASMLTTHDCKFMSLQEGQPFCGETIRLIKADLQNCKARWHSAVNYTP